MNTSPVSLTQARKEALELEILLRSINSTTTIDLTRPRENITAIRDKFKEVNNEIKFANSELSSLNSMLKANLAELSKGKNLQVESNRIQRSIVSISEQLKQDQYEITALSQKQLVLLKAKIEKERKLLADNIIDLKNSDQRLSMDIHQLRIADMQIATLENSLHISEEILDVTHQRLIFENKVQDALGITNDIAEGLQQTMKSLGFSNLSNQLGIDDAINKSKEFAKGLIEAKRIANLPGNTDNDGISVSGLDRIRIAGNLLGNLGTNLMKSLGPLVLLAGFIDSIRDADKDIGNIAKGFGTSYKNAAQIRRELTSISAESNNIFATTANLSEAQMTLNNALGTTAQLTSENLINYVELTKQLGYSAETATTLFKLSKVTGQNQKELTSTYLGQVKALNLQNKLQINGKSLLDSISTVSKATLLTFSKNPQELAKAAYEAKKVGLELKQIESIQNSLLDIESSIAAEFEAEVMTGKSLNLERARYYSLTNDISGLSKEISKQGIDSLSFGRMNVLQQESLAKSLGISRDEMAGMLLEKEALNKLNLADNEENRKKLQYLKDHGGSLSSIIELGKEEYENQKNSASVQERFLASVEKLKEAFVGLSAPLMPILDIFANIVSLITRSEIALKGLQIVMIALAAKSLVTAVANIFGGNAFMGPIGLPISIAATAALTTAAVAASNMKDGVVDGTKGPILSGDFGSVQFHPDDQIVAGTDLFNQSKTNSNISGDGGISMLASTLGNKMDIMINKLDNIVSAINKGMVVNLDGSKVSQELLTPLAISNRRI